MKYTFNENLFCENSRYYIKIPFNVWQETGLKGNIPVNVDINGLVYECKLLPKGKGNYWLPVTKTNAIKLDGELNVCFEPIETLTRINHDSPYSKNNPIRKISFINEITIQKGNCGQTCLAMLTGLSLSNIITVTGKGTMSWSKIKETLDYYGISYSDKMIYPRNNQYLLPKCCIVYVNDEFVLWYNNRYYGTTITSNKRITSILEINI